MFAGMCEFFINQLKISRSFYQTEYDHVLEISKKGRKFNHFGTIVEFYLRCKSSNKMELFDQHVSLELRKKIEDSVEFFSLPSTSSSRYYIKVDPTKIDSTKNELKIKKASHEFSKFVQMPSIHNNNAIISMLIRLEQFFQNYFEWLIQKYPTKYLSEKSIKYSDLIQYDFLEMKQQLISESASNIMSQPFKDWISIIRSHKYNLDSLNPFIEEFKEIYYRRNLIVHNDSVINRLYLENVKSIDKSLLGQIIKTDQGYILNAYSVCMIMVYGILFASLKSNPDDKEEFIDFLFSSGFNHMMDNDWKISKYIFSLLSSEKNMSESTLILSQINYCISCKNIGEFDSVKQLIEDKDCSALSPAIKMAKEILLDRYESGMKYLEAAIGASELTPNNVETWPLFIQFRETDFFQKFKQQHAIQIEEQEICQDDLQSQSDLPSLNLNEPSADIDTNNR